jgi:hypothetical protein
LEESEEEQESGEEERKAEPVSQNSARRWRQAEDNGSSQSAYEQNGAAQQTDERNGGLLENPYQTAIEGYRSFARAQLARYFNI